jgi:hypothetical protein
MFFSLLRRVQRRRKQHFLKTYMRDHIRIWITCGIWGCIQKFPNRPPGDRTANGTALCHLVQLYRYSLSQCSESSHHNRLCCLSTSVYCLFHYRLSPETFRHTLICVCKIGQPWRLLLSVGSCITWGLLSPVTRAKTLTQRYHNLHKAHKIAKSLDSSAVWRWDTGWTIGSSGPGRGWEFFVSPPRPDRFWDQPSLLSNGYQRLFPRG